MTSISDLVKARTQELSFRWIPVLRRDGQLSNRVADVGKLVVEELAFFPSKVWVLSKVLRTKAKTTPGILLAMYMMLVYTIAVLPILLIQSVVWQLVRGVKALWLVMTGRVTYRAKSKSKKE